MGLGELDRKCCRGRGSSLGLRGCGVARATCGDSDLEKSAPDLAWPSANLLDRRCAQALLRLEAL